MNRRVSVALVAVAPIFASFLMAALYRQWRGYWAVGGEGVFYLLAIFMIGRFAYQLAGELEREMEKNRRLERMMRSKDQSIDHLYERIKGLREIIKEANRKEEQAMEKRRVG